MLASIVLWNIGVSSAMGQSRFDEIRSEVRGGATPEAPPKQKRKQSNPSYFNPDRDEEESFGDRLFGSILSAMLVDTYRNTFTEGNYESHLGQRENYFAHYPYADGLDGYVMNDTQVTARPQTGAIRLRSYYSTDFDDIQIWHGDGLIEWNRGFAVDGQIDYLLESRPNGFQDNLTFGDLNGSIRLLTRQHSLVRAGLGLNWLEDRGSTDLGINSTLMWDWFPTDPLTISTQIDYGLVGDASTLHLESTLGATWGHIELFGGYNYRRIGGVDMAGPVFGIRGWW